MQKRINCPNKNNNERKKPNRKNHKFYILFKINVKGQQIV